MEYLSIVCAEAALSLTNTSSLRVRALLAAYYCLLSKIVSMTKGSKVDG